MSNKNQPKRYRLLTQYGYCDLQKGNVYRDDLRIPNFHTLKNLINAYPKDWEEVRELVNEGHTKQPQISLTSEQYEDLVNGILVAIKNTADIGMEDMPEVRNTAEQTVNDWANKFNIQLP